MSELVRSLHHDPFAPVLFNSPALEITEEQRQYLWEVYQTGASDSRFAQKIYNATIVILTSGSIPVPEVTSLSPNTAAIGSESFTLHVIGKNFDTESKVVWNGVVEPTIFVSQTELTTGVNMGSAEAAIQIPVSVQLSNGVLSNSLLFELTPAEPAGDVTDYGLRDESKKELAAEKIQRENDEKMKEEVKQAAIRNNVQVKPTLEVTKKDDSGIKK